MARSHFTRGSPLLSSGPDTSGYSRCTAWCSSVDRDDDRAAGRPDHEPGAAAAARSEGRVGVLEQADEDQNRDCGEDPKGARHAIERAVRIVDPEAYGVRLHGGQTTRAARALTGASHPHRIARAGAERAAVEP